MKTIYFLLFFCFFHGSLLAQETPIELATAAFYEEEFDNTLILSEKILKDYPIKSNEYAHAFLLKGQAFLGKSDTVRAKQYFIDLLALPIDKHLKHKGSVYLAEIATTEKKWAEGLQYIELSEKKYPLNPFCGNQVIGRKIQLATYYAHCYMGLNEPKKALKKLLPWVIENNLAENDELVTLAAQIIKKEYSNELIQAALIATPNSFKEKRARKKVYQPYFCTFLGEKIPITEGFFEMGTTKEDFDLIDKYENDRLTLFRFKFPKTLLSRLLVNNS